MKNKIEDVLSQISGDILTEDSKKMLAEAFEDAVKAATTERLDLEVGNALQKLDDDHSVKLEQLLEAIDADHTQKLVAVLDKVDEDHTEKLQFLVKRNNKILREDAVAFKEAGKTEDELFTEELLIIGRFRKASPLAGGFLGLSLGIALVALTIRKTRTEYKPHQGKCVSCGVCFKYCPVEVRKTI